MSADALAIPGHQTQVAVRRKPELTVKIDEGASPLSPRSVASSYARVGGIVRDFLAAVTPFQVALGATACDLICFSLVATIILIIFSLWYLLNTVEDTQDWYTLYGAAGRAVATALSTLDVAVQAQTALHGTACSGLIAGSSDYAAYERALTSLLLVSRGLRSVELSFVDKRSVISLGSKRASGGNWIVDTTSNEELCFLLGPTGCASLSGSTTPARPDWAEPLLVGSSGRQSIPEGEWDCEYGSRWGTVGWDDAPELLEHVVEDEQDPSGETIATGLFPTYRFLFRVLLPDPTLMGEYVTLAGRVTLEVGGLSGETLQDAALGSDGAIYLCDRHGVVLTAPVAETTLKLSDGRLYLKRITELPGMEGYSELASIFNGGQLGPDRHLRHSSDGGLLVVSSLPPPHHQFAIVAVSPRTGPFIDWSLYGLCITALVAGFLPYFLLFCGFMCFGLFGGHGSPRAKHLLFLIGRQCRLCCRSMCVAGAAKCAQCRGICRRRRPQAASPARPRTKKAATAAF